MKKWHCVFCKKDASHSPASREDVFAKWIIRELNAQTSNVYRTDTTTGIRHRARGNAGVLTRTPCRKCNGGWMSVLEDKVKPIFSKLMRGDSFVIQDVDQLVISKWMLKTAIMYDYAKLTRGDKIYFNSTHRTNLYEHGLLPTYTRIFAARFSTGITSSTERPDLAANTRTLNTTFQNDSGIFQGEAKCVTFVIEQLALQLFTVRDHPKHGASRINFRVAGNWDEVALPIYPISGIGIAWPPKFFIDDAGLELFMGRWDHKGISTGAGTG